MLRAILYARGDLQILDQLQLPHQEIYQHISTAQEAWRAIKEMRVRGAPAIAIVAALALAVELHHQTKNADTQQPASAEAAAQAIVKQLAYLVTSRPTAVNLADAARKLEIVVAEAAGGDNATGLTVREAYIHAAEQMLVDDVRDNEAIGRHGAEWLRGHARTKKISVLTHCNTGSLATAGHGTALGIVRTLHTSGLLHHVYYTETRPYNQGSRLTGFELLHDHIPCTLITDNMAGALFAVKGPAENIAAVIVGADRVAANGDTANKIGTYALAVLARYHGVKFLVAAPRTTIDLRTASGKEIVIEERAQREVLVLKGPVVVGAETAAAGGDVVKVDVGRVVEVSVAAGGTQAWNPSFDVTPMELVDGIVTEVGVVEKVGGVFDLEGIMQG